MIPASEGGLPLYDAGLVQGVIVTDLVRTFAHRLIHLEEHLNRFRQSASLAEIRIPLSNHDLKEKAHQLVGHNISLIQPDRELILVMLATPGAVSHYLEGESGIIPSTPSLVMHTFILPFRRYVPLFTEGARLAIPSIRQVPTSSVNPRIKQRSRIHWYLAEKEVQKSWPGRSALLMDQEGFLTETAAANFLIVKKGVVISPPDESVLPGVSLKVTMQLCNRLAIPFIQQPLTLKDCEEAEEAFLCSTPYGVAGVKQLENKHFNWPGPITSRLQDEWDALTGIRIRDQFLSFR
jgi:branched-subunit amino acid aminotransferase/4-amino-4-deoxychorismate lyase